ncbi:MULTISPECIES: sugar nucleotide-binding protein [Kocuria]|uniref:sugar nucleotide-binding protein n=1 Tax=Kocuria TaxID=57493 RepID=UPI00045EBDF9|nr:MULTISPECIES: sugar nucleotide-binding protein [Kocuria]MBM7824147.1 dTDP-4-dehydrorhamnose 3,5-epimerase [Kocuria palustris]MCY1683409.1 sugar nucleotide-binding protein [Kocuria sp. SL71]MDH5151465.1 sugar nucleotide-binding protein [Kocuria palustris]GLU87404.1 dTDP-4-dehydrorhamnose reductase [Kocuria sp. NBRC 114282]
MKITETAIPGLLIVQLDVHGDSRGWFKENWQRQKMTEAGLPDIQPVQNNISFNGAIGTTRGLHAEPWEKYVSVATGRVFGAWVDLREGESFGAVVTQEIGPDTAVFVPRGVANGFQTLEPSTAYTYLVTAHWSPEAQSRYTFLDLADETAAIDWPVPLEQAELSDKDREHPRLAQVAPVRASPVLILGAAGQLGRALVAACRRRGIAHRALTRGEWDMEDPGSWPLSELETARAVLNASAFTAVDEAETAEGRSRAWQVNATAVGALAAACRDHDVPLTHVSTDYVFDGSLPLDQEHAPEHPVAPLSVYGQSKAAGEAAVRTWPKHWIVRTSWVIGDGANFVRTMASLAERGIDPAVVDDQHGRLTFAADLAEVLLDLVVEQAPYGTRHVTNAGPAMSWFQVARAVFELTGHDPQRVSPVSTADFFRDRPGAAPRPRNSLLGAEGTLPQAMESLSAYTRTFKEQSR